MYGLLTKKQEFILVLGCLIFNHKVIFLLFKFIFEIWIHHLPYLSIVKQECCLHFIIL